MSSILLGPAYLKAITPRNRASMKKREKVMKIPCFALFVLTESKVRAPNVPPTQRVENVTFCGTVVPWVVEGARLSVLTVLTAIS